MKRFTIMLCLIFCLSVVGCNKQENVNMPSSSIVETNPPTESVENEGIEESQQQDLLMNAGFSSNTKFKVSESFFNSYQTENSSFTIEDRIYKQDGHKGKFNIHYPYFKGNEKEYEVLNSIILSKVVETKGYGADERIRTDELEYEIMTSNDNYVSILFTGRSDAEGAPHPINEVFTINFDMKYQIPITLYDILKEEDDTIKKIHSAMNEQWDKEITKEFEKRTVEDIEEQLYQNEEPFYIKDGKIYIQLAITAGAGFYDFVSFDIEA